MKFKSLIIAFFLLLIPLFTSAHEMYVLPHDVAERAIAQDSPNPFEAVKTQTGEFIFWAVGALVLFFISLRLSFSENLQKKLSPFFESTKKHAPHIVRIALGASLIGSAVTGVLFGPELPLFGVFGSFALGVKVLLIAVGSLMILGFYNKVTSSAVIFLFIVGLMRGGIYAAVYASFLGAALFVHIREYEHYKKTAFFVLRIFYGLAIIWSAVYAKLIFSNLAFETIIAYNITDYLPFTPMFLVLGAFLVEVLVGLCIILGVQLRLIALIFTGFLVQSLCFFGEAVTPHLILFGLNIALIAHGYDKYTLLKHFTKKELDPVL